MGSLAELAAWLGQAHHLEQRCFEILGGWVPDTPEHEAKALFAEQCYHHAWHAEVWAERFPAGYGHELEAAGAAPSPALTAALDALATAPGTAERLVGFYRVLQPRKIVAYDRLRRASSPVGDRPVLRWLELVLRDEVEDWRSGEALAQQALRAEAATQALAWQVALEARFVTVGDLLPVPS
jgi:hypothetical protein